MKSTLFFVLLLIPLLAGCTKPSPEPTLLLRNGTVFSGADEPPVVTDVWVQGDRIVATGDGKGFTATRVVDVSGLAVAPGFIDLHTHGIRANDIRSGLYQSLAAESALRQGVTTVIGGPDGWSPVPVETAFERLQNRPVTVNFGTYIGHGAVRSAVVGLEDRPPSAEEIDAMKAIVDEAMKQGAFGLSSGLVYVPGRFAETKELVELARVAGVHGGIYTSHMRDEALEVLSAVRELIAIAEEAGLPGHITHVKAMGTSVQGSSAEIIRLVDDALARGVDISMDQYPYAASSTGLSVQFPRWSRDGGNAALADRLKDPELRAKIHAELVYQLTEVRGRNDPKNVQLAYCSFDHSLDGLNLAEILRRDERDVTVDNAATLIMELQAAGGCQAVYHAMHPDDVIALMQHPRTMIASDGGVEVPGSGHPHPRNYGTYPRVLGHYVRELDVLPLHTAVHKMTLLPAKRIGLSDRGRIEAGAVADIVVFDPESIIDNATFSNPHQYATGVHHVLVAGEFVLMDEAVTDARPGRILRSSSWVAPE